MATIPLLQWGRKGQPRGYRNHLVLYPQFYAILITKGQLRIEINQQPPKSIGPGWGLILTPGATFTLTTPERGYQGHFLEWAPEHCPFHHGPHALRLGRPILTLVNLLEAEYAGQDWSATVPMLCNLLATCLLRQAQETVRTPHDIVKEIRERCAAHLHTPTPVADVLGDARWVRTARRHLRSVGMATPKRLLLDMRLDEARRLLRTTQMPITAIAMELGFPSSQYFATCYRKRFSLTPRDDRSVQEIPTTA